MNFSCVSSLIPDLLDLCLYSKYLPPQPVALRLIQRNSNFSSKFLEACWFPLSAPLTARSTVRKSTHRMSHPRSCFGIAFENIWRMTIDICSLCVVVPASPLSRTSWASLSNSNFVDIDNYPTVIPWSIFPIMRRRRLTGQR